jgi:hypothetical protein
MRGRSGLAFVFFWGGEHTKSLMKAEEKILRQRRREYKVRFAAADQTPLHLLQRRASVAASILSLDLTDLAEEPRPPGSISTAWRTPEPEADSAADVEGETADGDT